jgi:hypothetical protein
LTHFSFFFPNPPSTSFTPCSTALPG